MWDRIAKFKIEEEQEYARVRALAREATRGRPRLLKRLFWQVGGWLINLGGSIQKGHENVLKRGSEPEPCNNC